MNYLDTTVVIAAVLKNHPEHDRCFPLLNRNSATCAHALAEAFAALTVVFGFQNFLAAEVLEDLSRQIHIETISASDYVLVLRSARQRGIVGGIIYDALHGEVARRLKVAKVLTHNVSHFRHVAPDLLIETP